MKVRDRQLSAVIKPRADAAAPIDDGAALRLLAALGDRRGVAASKIQQAVSRPGIDRQQQFALVQRGLTSDERRDVSSLLERTDVQAHAPLKNFLAALIGREPLDPTLGAIGAASTVHVARMCDDDHAGPRRADMRARAAVQPRLATLPSRPAEDYMQPIDRGFWADPKKVGGHQLVRGFVDFAVNNYEFHKKVAVKLRVTRDNGVVEEYLYRPRFKGQLDDGRERWGTDAIELFPQGGPNGNLKSVDVSYLVQADVDGDGQRDLCQSKNVYRLTDAAALAALSKPAARDAAPASANLGAPAAAGANPDFGAREVDTAGARGSSHSFKDTVPPIEVYFAPYDHPERAVCSEIDRVIAAKQADPDGYHYIHAAVFDVNDDRIVDRLLAAHAVGVDVQLSTAAYHLTPDKTWETQYQRLQQAGIPVLGVVREGVAASMHTKIAVFDGQVAMTGSYNWETRAAEENCENVMLLRSPELAGTYHDVLDGIAGKPQRERPIDPASKVNVYYSQQHDVPRVICDELDQAKQSITVSMFTLRSLRDRAGSDDVLDALLRAKQRGVAVTVLLEKNIADAGEYFGRTTPDDPTDERLAAAGIDVVKIHTNYHNNKYAAMHHKFAVIDGATTMSGAYNWYGGSLVSDDDLIVVRDPAVARRYLGEVTNLRRHYDPEFDVKKAAQTATEFVIRHDQTRPGDEVYLVGNIPELGGWDPKQAIPLAAENWPDWKAAVDIPAGTHFEYKLFVKNHWGLFWENGANREHTATVDAPGEVVAAGFR